MRDDKYSTNEIVKLFHISKETILQIVEKYNIQFELRKGGRRYFTIAQMNMILDALKAEKNKNNATKHKVETLLKAHPEGLTIKEIAEHLHKSITYMRNVMSSVDLLIWDDGERKVKYYYAGKTKVKGNKTIILAKQSRLIAAIKKTKNGLTLKEAARILKVPPPEAREFISGIDERENIECVSCDDGMRYRYAGF